MDDVFDDAFPTGLVESLFSSPQAPVPVREPRGGSGSDSPRPGGSDWEPVSASNTDRLLDGLNPPQREAVTHTGSPLLVVAGAGSGKTRVLTRRIAYLIGAGGVHPGAILAITFTNKAAAEMRERVTELVGNRSRFMWVATFHSACVRILRADIDKLGVSTSFSIYDDTDSRRLVSSIMREKNLDTKKFPVRTVRSWISDQKNALIDSAQATSQYTAFPQQLYAEIYGVYQERLRTAQALDFDDLLMLAVTLFQNFPSVLEHYRNRFHHVLVDEYQDTNHAQYLLIQLLCSPNGPGEGKPPELMVVGDSDQSIYAFRGASIENILNFSQDFPSATTIRLEQNYRSTQNILSAANALIVHNQGRPDKNLWTDSGDGPLLTGYVADTEHDEARFIADEVKTLSSGGSSRYGDTAVFYRTNAQSRAIEEVFIRSGVPYRIVGGLKFYERKEVRDAIAYLRVLANPADDVSMERIINVPKRGIGATTEDLLRSSARSGRMPLSQVLEHVDEVPGLGPRAIKPLSQFAALIAQHREMVLAGAPVDEILRSILQESGYIDSLKDSGDIQDESRLENLAELVAVAVEFVGAAHEFALPESDEVTHDDDPRAGDDSEWMAMDLGSRSTADALSTSRGSDGHRLFDGDGGSDQTGGREHGGDRCADGDRDDVPSGSWDHHGHHHGDADRDTDVPDGSDGVDDAASLLGAPEPDDSLAGFLERIALVADSDEIPGDTQGAVTLMTLHTAKGLEFDTVFVTGFEDGLFPHERALEDRKDLEEERRLAYVGLTRARQRLYITRAEVRTMWGSPMYNPPSRFLKEIPDDLVQWRRLDRVSSWDTSGGSRTSSTSGRPGSAVRSGTAARSGSAEGARPVGSIPVSRSTTARPKTVLNLVAGDKVLHTTFGLGTVKSVNGTGDQTRAEVDFGSYGVKLLVVMFAPMEKL
ncbi:MAG: UvrD-helicase domain-containing protein [Propionibacteriaceae bacterium]|nr:UvrD-helicase domain-containing protein [Propionibacteriaceae bacterium]